jgi:hypothetical protein
MGRFSPEPHALRKIPEETRGAFVTSDTGDDFAEDRKKLAIIVGSAL